MDASVIQDALLEAYKSTEVAAKLFFPERFSRPFSSIHKDCFAALDDPNERKVVIAAPRGIGKTSMAQLAYAAKKILFRETRFLVTVSSSATSAMLQSENLKNSLAESGLIKELFGTFKSKHWAKDMWIVEWADTAERTMVLPRGGGQQVRGVLHDDYRPDLIIVDDFEDDEEVLSEDQRKKKRDWFFSSLTNTIDRGNNNWKIVYIDTIKHEDCLLQRLLDDPSWASFRFQLCDDSCTKSNWPDFMSDEEVQKLAYDYRASGQIDTFYREYMNIPTASENAPFTQELFTDYDESDAEFKKLKHKLENFVIVDPAKTTNPKSAHTAILGVGLDTVNGKLYFRDLIADFLHPDEAINLALTMCANLNAHVLAIEVTSLNEFITYPYKNAIIQRGLGIELVELKARGKKQDRAKALIPMYKSGSILHNPRACNALEQQLLSFPRPKRWDCIDVAAYSVEMLEQGDRYFQMSGYESTAAEIEKEFKDLEDEEGYYDKALDYDEFELAPTLSVGGSF